MNMLCSVFTKPWPKLSVDELGELVSQLGFDGVELPVRPGFQLEPDQVEQELPGRRRPPDPRDGEFQRGDGVFCRRSGNARPVGSRCTAQ